MFDRQEKLKTRLRQWQHILELEVHIINLEVFHMVLWEHIIRGRNFWKKKESTLDDTMGAECHMGETNFGEGF